MSKAIKSTNPLKPIIMQLLKAKSGARKITNVVEEKDLEGNKIYTGSCLVRMGNGWHSAGRSFVYEDEVINAAYKMKKLSVEKA